MTFAIPALTAIETAVEFVNTAVAYGTKVYAFASEIFTVSAILWTLNFLANSIQKTYNAGLIVGKFYRTYLHKHLKSAAIRIIAGIIFVSILAFEGAVVVYNNRHKIVPALNDIRNAIGRQFVYTVCILCDT
jgi:hypothetical protein